MDVGVACAVWGMVSGRFDDVGVGGCDRRGRFDGVAGVGVEMMVAAVGMVWWVRWDDAPAAVGAMGAMAWWWGWLVRSSRWMGLCGRDIFR